MTRNPLHELNEHGQSVWLDFISRELVTTDQLRRLISDFAVSGMTSNPTIFQKAMEKGTAYDEQIRDLATRGVALEEAVRLQPTNTDVLLRAAVS